MYIMYMYIKIDNNKDGFNDLIKAFTNRKKYYTFSLFLFLANQINHLHLYIIFKKCWKESNFFGKYPKKVQNLQDYCLLLLVLFLSNVI